MMLSDVTRRQPQSRRGQTYPREVACSALRPDTSKPNDQLARIREKGLVSWADYSRWRDIRTRTYARGASRFDAWKTGNGGRAIQLDSPCAVRVQPLADGVRLDMARPSSLRKTRNGPADRIGLAIVTSRSRQGRGLCSYQGQLDEPARGRGVVLRRSRMRRDLRPQMNPTPATVPTTQIGSPSASAGRQRRNMDTRSQSPGCNPTAMPSSAGSIGASRAICSSGGSARSPGWKARARSPCMRKWRPGGKKAAAYDARPFEHHPDPAAINQPWKIMSIASRDWAYRS
jgi:hypothetical protein